MTQSVETREQIIKRLTQVFQDVFDEPKLVLSDQMTAKDVARWDSLNHINLVVAVEQTFNVRFNTAEVARMANVGELVDVILRKTTRAS